MTVRGNQHLASRLQEQIDALPRVGDDARASTGGFEHARRWRESVAHHAVSVHVEHRQWRAIERIVIARVEMPHVADVWRKRLVVPAVACKYKLPRGQRT